MATGQDTVKSYIGDLIAALRHVFGAIEKQCDNTDLARIDGAKKAVTNIHGTLSRQIASLEVRADDMGGTGAMGAVKDAVTSVTGFVTGLYGSMRGETASRLLRDDYAALTFVSVCTAMLHTTALAVGDAATAQLTRQNLNDFPPLIMALNDLLPPRGHRRPHHGRDSHLRTPSRRKRPSNT